MPRPRPIAALLLLAACAPEPAPRPTLTLLTQTPGTTLQPALSADGTLLVTSDGTDLWLRAVGAPEAENLTADFAPAATQPALSPDAAHLAFIADGALTIAGPRGEHPQRLVAEAHDPAFSPDSTQIAYADATGLWLTDLQGGPPQAVLRTAAPRAPVFSPDGRFLAFLRQDETGEGLFVVPAAGGPVQRLVEGAARSPAWAPHGDALLYLAHRGDVSALLRLPLGPEAQAAGPAERVALLPEGAGETITIAASTGRIAVAAGRAEVQIFAAPFDPAALAVTGPLVQLTHGRAGARCPQPSPDGHGLAWVSPGPLQDLFIADPDGGRPRALSSGETATVAPHWMPDGDHLLFGGRRGEREGLWSLRLADGTLRRVSGDSDPSASLPLPSPDGTRVAFTGDRPHLFVIWLDVDWDKQVHAQAEGPGEGWTAAAWSPDGAHLAVTDLQGHIALMEAGDVLARHPLAARGDWPLWTPDGQHLLVGSGARVDLFDLATGATRPLLEPAPHRLAPPMPLALSPSGDRLYLALDISETALYLLEPTP
ncbi:MAG: hypothetical protein ABIO70_15430 [Pseudomonadota bacterium]